MDFRQEQTQAQTQICQGEGPFNVTPCLPALGVPWPETPGPPSHLLLASVVSPFLRPQGDGYSDPRWLSGERSPV